MVKAPIDAVKPQLRQLAGVCSRPMLAGMPALPAFNLGAPSGSGCLCDQRIYSKLPLPSTGVKRASRLLQLERVTTPLNPHQVCALQPQSCRTSQRLHDFFNFCDIHPVWS